MSWKIRNEMLSDTNGSHARTAAAVRNCECFVKVEMADVSSKESWRGKADLSVHVGSVHIDLASVFVDNFTHFMDGVLILSSS